MAQHPNSLKNLIPFASLNKEEHLEISRRGGRARADSRLWSSLVRQWEKEKKLTPEQAENIKLMLSGQKTAALRVMKHIETSTKIEEHHKAALLIKAMGLIHGDKKSDTGNTVNIQPVTINIGINYGNKTNTTRPIRETSTSTRDTE